MACRLTGVMPLSARVLEYCKSDPLEQISGKSLKKLMHFHTGKLI